MIVLTIETFRLKLPFLHSTSISPEESWFEKCFKCAVTLLSKVDNGWYCHEEFL